MKNGFALSQPNFIQLCREDDDDPRDVAEFIKRFNAQMNPRMKYLRELLAQLPDMSIELNLSIQRECIDSFMILMNCLPPKMQDAIMDRTLDKWIEYKALCAQTNQLVEKQLRAQGIEIS